ncbi:MAG: DNA-3-methyladenine glycosylase I [Firmicutes bacterium]|nr:DNA-3-methyladenine glycosylase I [Bacillota bacterium]
MKDNIQRCPWPDGDERMIKYHDTVWGVPVYDDQKLFAKLSLDLMQAGLMWRTILHKQQNFERAFDNFDIETVANYDEAKYESLMQDAGIVRNQLKIRAIINNAKRVLEIQKEFGTFSKYIWAFVDNKTIVNSFNTIDEIPAKTPLSDAISKDLLKRGFKFVGSTIIYAWMQAIGMVNDHMTYCFRYMELIENT